MAPKDVFELPELSLKLNHQEKERLYLHVVARAREIVEGMQKLPIEQQGDWITKEAREFAVWFSHSTPIKLDALAIAVQLGMAVGYQIVEAAHAAERKLIL